MGSTSSFTRRVTAAFAPFGQTPHVLGGTLVQLALPAACLVQLWREDRRFDAGVAGMWFCESLMYMAGYVADARAQVLPLAVRHIHDWSWLLSRWRLLDYCEALGATPHALASVAASFLLCHLFILLQAGRQSSPRPANQRTSG